MIRWTFLRLLPIIGNQYSEFPLQSHWDDILGLRLPTFHSHNASFALLVVPALLGMMDL